MVNVHLAPEEFLPRESLALEEDEGLSSLFDEEEARTSGGGGRQAGALSRDADTLECVSILATDKDSSSSLQFQVRLPPDKSTLFAHRVWSGSKILSQFLLSNRHQYVADRRTIELGAGTALPSLVALACGSRCSVMTDYPDEDLLQSIRETVGLNWVVCRRPINRVAVVGHAWGSSVEEIQQATTGLLHHDGGDPTIFFDTVLLSECLWKHRSHRALAQSIDRLLHPDRGFAVVTYAHHVPGCEKEDVEFFDICGRDFGLETIHQGTCESEYTWDTTKTMLIHLRVLTRKAAVDHPKLI
jgi:nicotinamide N-methyltransferase